MEVAQRVAEELNGEIRHAQGVLAFAVRTPGVASGNLLETQRALLNLMRSLPSVQEAMEVFGRTSLLINEVQAYGIESLKYILHLRGVFTTWNVRKSGGKLDDAAKKMLAQMLAFARLS